MPGEQEADDAIARPSPAATIKTRSYPAARATGVPPPVFAADARAATVASTARPADPPTWLAVVAIPPRTGRMIQAQIGEAISCEPPSVTVMTRKLEASGHIRRRPAPSDKRATIVELTDSGRALTDQAKELWCALAEETVARLPSSSAAMLPGLLNTLAGNVDTRRSPDRRGQR